MYFESKRQDIMMSGFWGSIGFIFPAAMEEATAYEGASMVKIIGS